MVKHANIRQNHWGEKVKDTIRIDNIIHTEENESKHGTTLSVWYSVKDPSLADISTSTLKREIDERNVSNEKVKRKLEEMEK